MAVINTNITALIGQQNLTRSQSALQTSMERLSSGLRINSAADDAAGQAIANRMSAQVTGLAQAQRNANDGISVAQTAEGALNQVNDNLQRIRELTVQAANGTNSTSDLDSIQAEINQRLDEIDRISEQTSFNGVKVLAENADLSIQVGANDGEKISLNLQKIDRTTLNLGDFRVNGDKAATVANVMEHVSGVAPADVASPTGTVTIGSDTYNKLEDGSFTTASVETDIDESNTFTAVDVQTKINEYLAEDESNTVTISTDGTTSYTVNNDGSVEDSSGVVYAHTDENGDLALVAEDDATLSTSEPLKALDTALSQVDNLRSDLGAIQNRFESAIDNLSTTTTNLSAARSRIEDADYAVEVSNMTRAQILQQAGTSVLSQANQVPQTVLSLLR